MKIPVKEVTTRNKEKLEELVSERELWLVPFEWMLQFPPSETSGRTERSEWESILRYPKKNKIPEINNTYKVEKGLVHFAKGIVPEDFAFLETGIKEEFIPF